MADSIPCPSTRASDAAAALGEGTVVHADSGSGDCDPAAGRLVAELVSRAILCKSDRPGDAVKPDAASNSCISCGKGVELE